LRTAFFGSSVFSCLILKALLESEHKVAAIVTQPDQPAGRKMQMTPTPVAQMAAGHGIPLYKPQRLRGNKQFLHELAQSGLDALAVASYGKIIPDSLLQLTPWPLNVHPSPLPLLRGPSPLRTALLNGWDRTEVCIMRMTPQIDDGPVGLRVPLAIPRQWNHHDLERHAGMLGGLLLVEALGEASHGRLTLHEQDHSHATYTAVHTRRDSEINWRHSASELAAFVRAWDPDVGAVTSYHTPQGWRRLKVWRAAVDDSAAFDSSLAPGTVRYCAKQGIGIQTGAGVLQVLEVQPESRSRMMAGSFLAGGGVAVGDSLCPA
jgi:methionyl-tRNA formyltransferase